MKEIPVNPVVLENRKRLEALGVKVDEAGNFIQDGEAVPPSGVNQPDSSTNDADNLENLTNEEGGAFTGDPVPPTPAAPLAEAPQKGDRWEPREKSAKEEQRKLSALQTEVRRDLEELRKLKQDLEALKPALAGSQHPAPGLPPLDYQEMPQSLREKLTLLKDASPELTEAIEELTSYQATRAAHESTKPLLSVKAQLDEATRAAEERALEAKYDAVEKAVLAVHQDALEVTSSAEFQQFVSALPGGIRSAAYKAIYQDTASSDPAEIVHFINLYKNSKPKPNTPQPRVAPHLSPASASGNGRTQDGPLSETELERFPQLKAEALAKGPAALRQLMGRLEMTLNPTT